MRENTRCEVEEPISTPTVSRQISSSSASVRPVEEKKMRPPSASSVIGSRPQLFVLSNQNTAIREVHDKLVRVQESGSDQCNGLIRKDVARTFFRGNQHVNINDLIEPSYPPSGNIDLASRV